MITIFDQYLHHTTRHKTVVLAGKELVVTALLDTLNDGAGNNRSDEHCHFQAFLHSGTTCDQLLRRKHHIPRRLTILEHSLPHDQNSNNENTDPSSSSDLVKLP